MPAAAVTPGGGSTPVGSGALTALRVAGVLGATFVGALALQLPDLSHFSVAPVLLVCLGSVALAGAAVLLATEPGQRPNAALFGVAAVLFSVEWAFTWPATPLPFVALPFGQLFAVALGVVLLRYPGTRLTRGSERWFVAGAVVVTVVGRVLVEVTTRPQAFAAGLSAGHGQLPASALWISLQVDPATSHVIAVATDITQLCVVPVFSVLIVRRLRRESRPLRRELWPVVVSVLVLGGVLITHLVALLVSSYRPASAPNEWISAVLSVSVMLIPIAFITATVRARLARASVADLVVRLNDPMTSREVQFALRGAAADETLQVHYWLADSRSFVDVDGNPIEEHRAADRMTVPVTNRNGDLLAQVSADPALSRRPGTLHAAVAAMSMALENTRLEAELRARLADLRASRTRIAHNALDERRRIERDLHDGVQQQLIALGATLGRLDLHEQLPIVAAELVEQARGQLRRTRRELRDLARGVHPAVLAESGLAAAVSSVARDLPMPIRTVVPPRRWEHNLELTAYLVICESLSNCAKHAGATFVDVTVTVTQEVDRMAIRIQDDGAGGARITPGGGLAGLRDRVRALGGDLRVVSPSGAGTTLEVSLPCR